MFAHLERKFATFEAAFTNLLPQPGFSCSKLTIETLEQGVKYVQS